MRVSAISLALFCRSRNSSLTPSSDETWHESRVKMWVESLINHDLNQWTKKLNTLTEVKKARKRSRNIGRFTFLSGLKYWKQSQAFTLGHLLIGRTTESIINHRPGRNKIKLTEKSFHREWLFKNCLKDDSTCGTTCTGACRNVCLHSSNYTKPNYDNFLWSCSQQIQSEEQLREIRGARNKARIPQTLVLLSIKTVAKHCTRFIELPDSPLKHLRKLNIESRQF
jgi:hypothetical protein